MRRTAVIASRGVLTCSLILCVATNVAAQTHSSLSILPSTLRSLEARQATLPANLHVDGRLSEVVERMWERSPTFRRQCARLDALMPVTLRMHLLDAHPDAHARSDITLEAGRPTGAHVRIDPRYRHETVELIAHELEHIVEQLDGVDLASEVQRGVAKRLPTGHYETARAVEIGRRVAEETRRDRRSTRAERVAHPRS